MEQPLTGKTIALPETRQLDILARLLEERGATALRYPLVGIFDAPNAGPVEAWLRELAAGRCDDVILLTGEGLRRLLGFARRANIEAEVVAALAQTRKITRGPKPAKALSEIGLRPDLTAQSPTTEGVIATLQSESLAGRTVGVQLYGEEPNERLISFLREAGATPRPVAPYVYAPASDETRVVELIHHLNAGDIDVLAFTSSPQVERLWKVAATHGLSDELIGGLGRTKIAAVGPVVGDALRRRGAPVAIEPERSFFMRPLVNEIVAALS